MKGATLIYVLQVLLAFAWAVPLIRKTGAMVRVMKMQRRGDDTARAALWFVAAWVECGVLRWLIFSHSVTTMETDELIAWAGIYVLGIVSAFAVSYTYWERYYDGY